MHRASCIACWTFMSGLPESICAEQIEKKHEVATSECQIKSDHFFLKKFMRLP